jgi:hypothetical protein
MVDAGYLVLWVLALILSIGGTICAERTAFVKAVVCRFVDLGTRASPPIYSTLIAFPIIE